MKKQFLVGMMGACCLQTLSAQSVPNVVVIVADDLGKDILGCYGSNLNVTPYLDELASDGIRFTDAYCTSASSAASRAVILTGQFGHAINCYGHNGHASHNVVSLPKVMREAGYRVGQCGKLHVQPENVFHFDQYFKANARNAYQMAEACKDFIISKEDKPFFLYFCPIDPHRSDDFDKTRPYQPNLFGNRAEGYEHIPTHKISPKDVEIPYFLPNTPACREELAQYTRSVSRFDTGVGHLIDLLKENGKYDNTLIVFISDNGIAFSGAKTNMYQPAMNLPCIVKMPNQKWKGTTSNSYISWADLTPTLAEFVDWHGKNRFMGKSFLADLKDPTQAHCDVVYGSHIYHEPTMYYPMRMIVKGDYKLIYNIAYHQPYPYATDLWTASTWQYFIRETAYKGHDVPTMDKEIDIAPYMRKFPSNISILNVDLLAKCEAVFGNRTVAELTFRPQFELYNIKKDPHEEVNLANNPEYKQLLVEMKKELRAFQSRTQDPWTCKWFYE